MKRILLALLLVATGVFSGCTPTDPIDYIYTEGITITEPVWRDLHFPASAVRVVPGTDKTPGWYALQCGQLLGFEDNAAELQEQEIYFTALIPNIYVDGSAIYPHIHYTYTVNQTGTSSRWGLEYFWFNEDEQAPACQTIYALTDASANDAYYHLEVFFPVINGTGKLRNSMLVGRLFRNSSHADDDFTDTVYLLGVGVYYQRDILGSLVPG